MAGNRKPIFKKEFDNPSIPIGPSYLIPILKEKRHEVSLFDTSFYDFDYSNFNISGKIDENGRKIIEDFKNKVAEARPDLIGVSISSLCLNFSLKMLESLGDKPPLTVFGGAGVNVDYMNLIKKRVVDYLCVGFAEESLPRLVESLENKKSLEDISNLVYESQGKIIKNKFCQEIDLSKLPIPDWSLFDKRHNERIFKGKSRRLGNFQLTRGCPFNCTYCVNDYYHKELGMRVYRFPVEKIIQEIKHQSEKHNLEIVRIYDECFFTGNLEYYKKFAKNYKKEINLPTIVNTRPETINPETIKLLKDINCIAISIGIEVGKEKQRLEMLNRHVSNSVIKNAFKLVHKAGIRVASYNIIGFPHDTRERIFETIKLNRQCKPDYINLYLFNPLPKTQLREYCLKNDLLEVDAIVDFLKKSIMKIENLSKEELYGLFRTFKYYVKLPEYLFPLVKRAETSDKVGNIILNLLEKTTILKDGY